MTAHAAVDFAQVVDLVLPVTLIATLVPLSLAGWGVRQAAMVLAFSYAGPADDGLIVSVLYGIVNLAVDTIGGFVWVGSGYHWRSVRNIKTETLAPNL